MTKAIKRTIFALGLTCIGVAIAVALLGCAASKRAEIEKAAGREAYSMAKKLCLAQLKSPATASFSPSNGSDALSTATRVLDMKTQWQASGRVDSQNSSGALVRSDWVAVVEHRGAK